MEKRNIVTIDELNTFAHEVVNGLASKNNAHVLALHGDLGAGKTAFVKELGHVLSIEETITSPTFVIMKMYHIPSHSFFKTLVHIDAYRVERDDEMRILGLHELFNNSENIICIEWPERIAGLIPKDAHNIALALQGTERSITYDI